MSSDLEELYKKKCQDVGATPLDLFIRTVSTDGGLPIRSIELCGSSKLMFKCRLKNKELVALCSSLSEFASQNTELVQLTSINLENNEIGKEDTYAGNNAMYRFVDDILENQCTSFRNIQALNLRNNHLDGESCSIVCRALRDSSSILELNLSGNPCGNEGGQAIAELMKHTAKLEKLDISSCILGVPAIVQIATALRVCKTLKTLVLDNPLLKASSEECIVHLGKAVEVNTSLQRLSLAKFNITNREAPILTEYVLRSVSLNVLNLRANKIAGLGAKALAVLISQNRPLAELDFSSNVVGDEGAKAFASALKCNTNLRRLDLSRNSIGDEGLANLAETMAQISTLEKAFVWGNNFDTRSANSFHDLCHGRWKSLGVKTDITSYVVDGVVHIAEAK